MTVCAILKSVHTFYTHSILLNHHTVLLRFANSFDKSTESVMSDTLPFVHTTRVVWVDGAGIIRNRAVTARTLSSCREQGLGLTRACMAMMGNADMVAPDAGLDPVGEIRLVPDGKEYILPWMKSHALYFGNMQFPLGETWEFCPRQILRNALQLAHDQCDGLSIEIGFEIEFQLLHKDSLLPIDSSTYCTARAFDAVAVILDEMVDTMRHLGVEIEQFHGESANGQFEFALKHQSAELMVDHLYLARLAICAVAHRHNMEASFLPKSNATAAGNGQHVHMSIWRNGENLFTVPQKGTVEWSPASYRPPAEADSFMAGVLLRLPALMALTAPSPNSFRRVQPSCWTGAFRCWGLDNREAPLRLCSSPGGMSPLSPPSNFEVKCFDATANAYLGIAALVAAGVHGVVHNLRLPPPVQTDPAHLAESLREPLPACASAAAALLRSDPVLNEFMGSDVVACLAAVREAEDSVLRSLPLEDEVSLMMLKY